MAKQVIKKLKLQLQAGKATPAPPVGPALGPLQINMPKFCSEFNDLTRDMMGYICTAVVTAYDDKSFTIQVKTPPASCLIKKAAKIEHAGGKGCKEIVAKITKAQVKEIAEMKMKDLNANDLEAAMNIIAGTAKNMGVEVVD